MRVRAGFLNIDEVIATIKTTTIKNNDRRKDIHDAGVPSPPDPVITRWATRFRAALYYSENFPAVRTIVNSWTSAVLLVSRAKDAVSVEDVVPDLVKINQQRTLAANVELKGSACTITRTYGLLKNMQFDDDPCTIKNYIKKRLSNSDLETVITLSFPNYVAVLQKIQNLEFALLLAFAFQIFKNNCPLTVTMATANCCRTATLGSCNKNMRKLSQVFSFVFVAK